MSEALLSVRNVRVQFGRFLAVDDVSFDLKPGWLLGMIGPNGAGKTTTLRAATGLQPLSTGSVHVFGEDVHRNPTIVGHHLGFTPDTPQFYDTMTVENFLQFIGDCYGLPNSTCNERIDHWLDQLWLSEKRSAKISSLSRGMKQRLAVARTLLPDPHVILLDEPAAGLDPGGRVQFRRLLANLRDQGKAIIVSSHILADLAEYCTHIAIMERGRLLRFESVHAMTQAAEQDLGRYRVVLAERVGDAAARIAEVPGISRAEVDGDVIQFSFSREPAAVAKLLRDLISAGLPVIEFGPVRANLEEAYLRVGIAQVD